MIDSIARLTKHDLHIWQWLDTHWRSMLRETMQINPSEGLIYPTATFHCSVRRRVS